MSRVELDPFNFSVLEERTTEISEAPVDWNEVKAQFQPLVQKIADDVSRKINREAKRIDVDIQYKTQMALELLIAELKERV